MTQDAVPYHVYHADLRPKDWPDPTPDMLASPQFEAVWQCIKRWDINVPDVYTGYCGATGNHVRAILDALAPYLVHVEQLTLRPDPSSVLVVTLPAGRTDHIYEQVVEGMRVILQHHPDWHDVRIPLLFLEDGITLAQLDAEDCAALAFGDRGERWRIGERVRMCPHAPHAGCPCRKPSPWMLLDLVVAYRDALYPQLALSDVLYVGDLTSSPP